MSQAPSFVLFLLWFDCVIVICNWSHILIACSFYFLVNLLRNCCCVDLPSLALNEPGITWNWRRHKSLDVLGRSYTIIICSHRYVEPLAMPPMNNGARLSWACIAGSSTKQDPARVWIRTCLSGCCLADSAVRFLILLLSSNVSFWGKLS